MQTIRRTLDTGWRVREVPQAGAPAHNQLPWLPAQVPGHVHLDLMNAGVIPDPFQRLHERTVAWVDDSDWVYETSFTVDDPAPASTYLVFNGLDTVAEIMLNGESLGQTDNMYIPHEFPVGGKLKAGENVLQVIFRSARRVGAARQQAWNEGGNPTLPGNWDSWDVRSFVRKAQYMYGWDWGPVLLSCGLWKPVELVTVTTARILDWKHAVAFTGEGQDEQAVVTVTAEVERAVADVPLTLSVHAGVIYRREYDLEQYGAGVNESHSTEQTDITPISVSIPAGRGRVTVTASFSVPDSVRWQPNGYTEMEEVGPALYTVILALNSESVEATAILDEDEEEVDDDSVDVTWGRIGLRTIELIREPDHDGKGEGFKFRINGNDIFAKGANWIPNYSFPGTITREELHKRLMQARDAGFNMLRVWGGGLYESEDFYELCDELGLLVWQDFTYGCAYYPDTGEYADAARVEATAAVRRIRNHPSLALWCGNNENQMMFDQNWTGTPPPRLLGDNFYHDILPAVVAAEDPKTPYWPSSPFGGPQANSPDFGDCHNWDVWHGRGDWVHYTENDSRFCSEFGFAASCGLAAWDTVLAPADRHPHSPVVKWHDKTRKGYDTYLGYIGLHFPDPQTLEELVYFSQINQAEALKFGIEHYRRRKGHCWGTLFWQINDCWPVQSWAIIDSLGEPKAAYYASKKFYAPVLISLVRDGLTVTAHLVNDFLHPVAGTLTLSLEAVDGGAPLAQTIHEVKVGHNGTETVATFDLTPSQGREREVYLHADFQPGEAGIPVENVLLLAEPKDLRLSDPGLKVAVQAHGESTFVITLSAQRFAPYVWLRRSDNAPLAELEDNFFHLRAGESREIIVAKPQDVFSAAEFQGLLVVRSL